MSFCRSFPALTALGLALLLGPGWARAASNRTTVFALDASYYPPHVFLGGRVATDHEADHFIGNLHRSAFAELGRHPEYGWLQGAVWEPTFTVTSCDGSRQHEMGLITSGYLVSEYNSPQAAHAAVQDMYIHRHTWGRLDLGNDGRIVDFKDAGYTIIGVGFSEGAFDVEDVTLVSPGTPRKFYRTIKAAVLGQLNALDERAADLRASSDSAG